jgi:uncharacterized protein (TIGR03435 family)
MSHMRHLFVSIIASTGLLHSQTKGTPSAFEVASVKPTPPEVSISRIILRPGGRVTLTHFTLNTLVTRAYLVQNFQVLTSITWMASEPYDIEAEGGAAADPKTASVPPALSPLMREMLQSLLSERFQLTLHHETRQLPIYELTVTKGGPKLRTTEFAEKDPWWRYGIGEIAARNRTVPWLADSLTRYLSAIVLDHTGLAGAYDFDLKWAENVQDMTLPALPTALREFGININRTTGPVDVLVIDSATRPTEN